MLMIYCMGNIVSVCCNRDICLCHNLSFRVFTGADLKERAQMSNPEAELFVHGLRSLMNDIGET